MEAVAGDSDGQVAADLFWNNDSALVSLDSLISPNAANYRGSVSVEDRLSESIRGGGHLLDHTSILFSDFTAHQEFLVSAVRAFVWVVGVL